MVDAREGITEPDRHFAGWLRKSGKPLVLIANKAEGRAEIGAVGEAYALGLGDPVPLSAAHGEGFGELYDRLRDFAPLPEEAAAEEAGERPLQLAIVGRPNVGKSTLVNRLLGEDRLLTGPEPGITRNSIALEWQWHGRRIRLVDTAGLRRAPMSRTSSNACRSPIRCARSASPAPWCSCSTRWNRSAGRI